MKLYTVISFGFITLLILSCRDLYEPNLPISSQNVLIVEGFVDTGGDSTIITLSRLNSYDDRLFKPENTANVYIESEDGNILYLDG